MNAVKILFLLPLSIFCQNLSAQVEEILRNEDITWAVETYNDFALDESSEEKIGKLPNRVTPLKLLNLHEANVENKYVFQKWLLEAAQNEKLRIYSDENCTTPIHYDSIWYGTWVPQLDPFTHKNTFKAIPNPFNYQNIVLFRAKQMLFYNARKKQFSIKTLAVAPIFILKNEGTINPYERVPLFWFKPNSLTSKKNLNRSQIVWASQFKIFNGIDLTGKDVKILKQTTPNSPIKDWFHAFETEPKSAFYKTDATDNPTIKLSFSDRKNLLAVRKDTVTMPQSDSTSFSITEYQIKPDAIQRLQLRQNWYWNKPKNRLEIYLVATAPLLDVKIETGELLYRQPIFYDRNDD